MSFAPWNDEQWPELVSSYGVEVGNDFVLFDPLSVPDELREHATAIVLTAPYHERDARRLGVPVHSPSRGYCCLSRTAWGELRSA